MNVASPTAISYDIAARITLLTTADQSTLTTQLQAAAQTYANEKATGLGRDIVRSQLIAALSLEGVYSVDLTAPATDVVIVLESSPLSPILQQTLRPMVVVQSWQIQALTRSGLLKPPLFLQR